MIKVSIEQFQRCVGTLDDAREKLSDKTGSEPPDEIYDAYESAIEKYQSFISALLKTLERSSTKHHVGPTLKPAFEKNLTSFEALSKELETSVVPKLDGAKQAKMKEWAEKTTKQMKQGIAASG